MSPATRKAMRQREIELPAVEKCPLIVLRFTDRATDRLTQLVQQRLQIAGLICLDNCKTDNGRTVLTLSANQKTLESEAELIHIMKKKRTANGKAFVDRFTVKESTQFGDHSAQFRDSYGLFSASERSMLAYRILDGASVVPPGQESTELSRILDVKYRADTVIHVQRDESERKSESLRGQFREHGEQSACLRHVLQTYDLVDVIDTVHMPHLAQNILHRIWHPWYRLNPPVHAIQSYYGWEIGFYFAWMGMMTRWLVFPGVVGVLVVLFRLYRHDNIDNDEFTPFYGVLVFIWAMLFLRFWDRQERRLALQWGTYSLSPYQRQKFFAVRPEFRGFLRHSPVTGMPETYYPPFRRRMKYFVSAGVTIAMLSVAFVIMIMSINLQGYIRPKSNPSRWSQDHPHPFHVRSLAILAEEGRLFDSSSSWRCYVPVCIHVIFIYTLNRIYRLVAETLTGWENHETLLEHQNSLILKRFLFEAFDCYVALFYLAFYERDVERLRMELAAIFQIDTVRRLLLECIVPAVLQRIASRRQQKRLDSFLVHDSMIPTMDQIVEDLDKDPYEQFDDYMEIVIQLGYVTLFASAYPLASILSIVANWVETRSDCFKMANLCRRPVPIRTSGLGMWRDLMACVLWMSALTNCLIVGFTSDQLMHYLPSFYILDEATGYTDMGHEKSWIVVFVIFGLERLLIIVGLLIHAIVPKVPENVTDQLERQHYVLEQEARLTIDDTSKKKD
jgi:anoctamin-10